jgi:hypothetical protein
VAASVFELGIRTRFVDGVVEAEVVDIASVIAGDRRLAFGL